MKFGILIPRSSLQLCVSKITIQYNIVIFARIATLKIFSQKLYGKLVPKRLIPYF